CACRPPRRRTRRSRAWRPPCAGRRRKSSAIRGASAATFARAPGAPSVRRRRTGPCVLLLCLSSSVCRSRQRKCEGCTAVRCAFGGDTAAVSSHDALHERKADAGARELRVGVQALERAEKLVGITRLEAGAVVAHGINELS